MNYLKVFSPGTVLVLTLSFINIIWLLSGMSAADASSMLSIMLYVIPILTAALVISVAARQRRGKARLGWYLISLGILSLAIGSCIWSYFDLASQPRPSPSIADCFFLLFGPLCVAGLLNLIPVSRSRRENLKVGLDLAITIGALGLYDWFFFLAPSLTQGTAFLPTLAALAYPVVDLVLLSLVLVLIVHQWHDRASITKFFLIGLGLIAQVLGDIFFGATIASGSYYVRHPLEIFWMLSPVFFVLAARTSLVASFHLTVQQNSATTTVIVTSAKPYLVGALPYAAVASSLGLLFITQANVQTQNTLGGRGILYGVGFVILLVLARQLLSVYENRQLTRRLQTQSTELKNLSDTLEVKVQTRTSELEILSRRFQHDARHDPLTGLANRAYFQESLEADMLHCVSFAVLYLDFDRFKAINDSYGHEVGDKLLIAISARLKATLRQEDLIARLGGDEFAVLLKPKWAINVPLIAEKLTQAFQMPFQVGEYHLYSTASIGVVTSEGRESAQHVLRDADIAMYQAKTLGKSRYVIFESAMSEAIQARLALEDDLREAIKRHELAVHYQPIVRTVDSKIIGFEALVRWHHPLHGLISPISFIPIAEESNLIVDIDRWVLQTACAQLKAWETINSDLTLNVNFSSRQFLQADLALFVAGVLTKHGLESYRLKLELTESLLLDNSAQVRETLAALRKLGLRLHIDDFGTGYSSLAYLQRFDADVLKVDRSFVLPMLESSDSEKLVQTIVNLAHNLEMKVVAEGVETEGQFSRLKALGCDYLQGYLFSKPLPATEALQLLQATSASDKTPSKTPSDSRTYKIN